MPAKHQINLLLKDTFEESNLGKFVKWAITAGRWIIVFTDLVVICSFFSRFYFDTKLADLYDNIKQNQAIVAANSGFEESFRFLQKRLALAKSLSIIKFAGEEKISFISNLLPPDVYLNSFLFDQETITLSGVSLSPSGISNFIRYLLASPQVKSINISQLSINEKNQTETINFSLSMVWRKI